MSDIRADADGYCYVLRTCRADMTSYGGFVWPESGPVSCPDWQPTAECGNGLHGLLWGEGEGPLLDWNVDAKWLVVRVMVSSIIGLGGKVKFPAGDVVFCGDRLGATSDIIARGANPERCVGGTATAGYHGTATAGDRGTATAGEYGTATAGDGGTLIVKWFDLQAGRFRTAVAYIGEDGIKPNVAYRVQDGKFVEVQ